MCVIEGCAKPNRSARSPYCEMHYGRLRRNGDPERLVVQRKPFPEDGLCRQCGSPISEVWGYGFCSQRCYFRYRRGRREQAGHCAYCGATLSATKRSDAEYCSSGCLRQARYQRLAETSSIQRQCKECGSLFRPLYADKRRSFCSVACEVKYHGNIANHVRRARQRIATFERVSLAEIAERDGWVCRICGQNVDRSLKSPHPGSPSLDHITPLANGGQHTAGNLQLAHRICNIRKGARDIGSLALSAGDRC